ncbi:hypothetical protein P692DRAFT_20927488 [Suillus brevipes Sb2]|nr:hypothetical protein P692DRAFT_20927488 [Suillus brevipes Sb2]
MTRIHSKLDSLASRLVASNDSREEDEDDDDAIFAELEAEIENDADATKEAIRISANEPHCVIHFYHSNFRRCEIMDKHLAKLAPKYYAMHFIRVFVENMPWLVEKLAIKVLPCLMCFVDGVSKDRTSSGVLQKARNAYESGVTYNVSSSSNTRKLRRGEQTDQDDDEFDFW